VYFGFYVGCWLLAVGGSNCEIDRFLSIFCESILPSYLPQILVRSSFPVSTGYFARYRVFRSISCNSASMVAVAHGVGLETDLVSRHLHDMSCLMGYITGRVVSRPF
jgi:hypothetical protein